ncbi:hypothetical protein LMG10661_00797 [Ralstonia syzygii subsp. syzygii]|nr:hypothetical protein LMG10661_00797 [Ralstonia syzygii subsp. syzygii]
MHLKELTLFKAETQPNHPRVEHVSRMVVRVEGRDVLARVVHSIYDVEFIRNNEDLMAARTTRELLKLVTAEIEREIFKGLR